MAEAIVAAYPPTPGDAETLDITAAVKAIDAERAAGDGITGELILAAAKAVAANPPKPPLWCRAWLANRGYAKVAKARLRAAKAATAGDQATHDRGGWRAEAEVVQRHRDAIDATLANLGDVELDALKAEAIAAEPSETIRRSLQRSDPRTSSYLRELMVDRLKTKVVAA